MSSPEVPSRLQRYRGIGALAFLIFGLAALLLMASATLGWAVYCGAAWLLS